MFGSTVVSPSRSCLFSCCFLFLFGNRTNATCQTELQNQFSHLFYSFTRSSLFYSFPHSIKCQLLQQCIHLLTVKCFHSKAPGCPSPPWRGHITLQKTEITQTHARPVTYWMIAARAGNDFGEVSQFRIVFTIILQEQIESKFSVRVSMSVYLQLLIINGEMCLLQKSVELACYESYVMPRDIVGLNPRILEQF